MAKVIHFPESRGPIHIPTNGEKVWQSLRSHRLVDFPISPRAFMANILGPTSDTQQWYDRINAAKPLGRS